MAVRVEYACAKLGPKMAHNAADTLTFLCADGLGWGGSIVGRGVGDFSFIIIFY